jgi:hypothetical protein
MDRYKLIILLFLFIATPSHAGMMMMTGDGTSTAACADASCTGFLICQNFEQTVEPCDPCTEDTSETWDKLLAGTGTITVDYGTPLRGDESLQLLPESGKAITISETFAAQGTVYGFFRVKLADGRPTASNLVIFKDSEETIIGRISILNTGVFRLYNGTVSIDSTTALDDGASGTIYVWFYWTKGTGTDGTMGIEVNTSRTFGAWEATGTTGDANLNMTSITLTDRYVGGVVFDQVLLKTTAIGTVCE